MLRLFIDHLDRTDGIGIEDCVKVTKALDEPLDQLPEVDKAFGGGRLRTRSLLPRNRPPAQERAGFREVQRPRSPRPHFPPAERRRDGQRGLSDQKPEAKEFPGEASGRPRRPSAHRAQPDRRTRQDPEETRKKGQGKPSRKSRPAEQTAWKWQSPFPSYQKRTWSPTLRLWRGPSNSGPPHRFFRRKREKNERLRTQPSDRSRRQRPRHQA